MTAGNEIFRNGEILEILFFPEGLAGRSAVKPLLISGLKIKTTSITDSEKHN